jgi:hypothetical protein
MTPSSIGKHAGTGTASDQPTIPEPSYAERARTLMYKKMTGEDTMHSTQNAVNNAVHP